MSSSSLRRILPWLSRVGRDKKVWALLGILALGAYLRLWNIHHLFNILHDFDEGAYSLGARFIAQGYLPYQDFMLVHPPLYDLVLAGVYKIFGYGFFDGRYLSVALSLACIILIYLIGRKMYHPTAGLVAAALFAVSPDMVYLGRRAVQDILGIFLILLAIYFAVNFIQTKKPGKALFCGLAMGLAVATKYLFVPAVAAIVVTIVLLSMGERFWQSVKTLGRPALWVMYLCFAAIFCAFLLLLKWSLRLDVSVPFIDPMYLSFNDVAVTVLVFVVPFVISMVMLEKELPFKQWWLGLWGLRRNRGLWLLVGGTVIGFIAVTSFFWVKMPQEFFSQTVLLQQNRPFVEFPSLLSLVRTVPSAPVFLAVASLPILFVIPLILILLNRQSFSRSDCFLSVTLVVSFTLCQFFPALPRYYAPMLPFLFLGISQFVPPLDAKTLTTQFRVLNVRIKAGLLVGLAILLFFLSVTVALLTNYTGYDLLGVGLPSDEELVYRETLDYLEGAGAQKVYAANPIFTALSPDLESTLAFDTFAMLWLEEKPPEEIVEDLLDEGVDYVVLGSWVELWGNPYKEKVDLFQAVRRNARLVRVIEPDSPISTEIYLLGAEKQGIFNGDFAQWVTTEETSLPLGWEPVLVTGEGDAAAIKETDQDGVKCAGFFIYEDGFWEEDREATYAGIYQQILFPDSRLNIQVFPTVNTGTTGRVVLGSGIHFADEHGHSLIIGFSDEVDDEEVFLYGDGNKMLVIKNARLNQWSEYSIDLSDYWERAGWWQPKELEVYVLTSAYFTEPGFYAFYVAGIEAEDAATGTGGQ